MSAVTMPPPIASLSSGRLGLLAGLLGASAAGATLLVVPPLGALTAAPGAGLPWAVLAVVALLASTVGMRRSIAGQPVVLDLVPAVVGVGLWTMGPTDLVIAVTAGVATDLVLRRRQVGRVLVVNLSATVLGVLSALVVHAALAPRLAEQPTSLTGEVATLAATTSAALLATAVTAVAATVTGRQRPRPTDAAWLGGLALVVGLLSGGLAVGLVQRAASTGWTDPRLAVVMIPPVLAVVAGVLHDRERRVRAFAELLVGLGHSLGELPPEQAEERLLEMIGVHFGADAVELRRRRDAASEADHRRIGDVAAAFPSLATFDPGPGEVVGVDLRRGPVGAVIRPASAAAHDVVVRVARRRPFTEQELDELLRLCEAGCRAVEIVRLDQLLGQLTELDEMKNAFLTAVSHDLRTPLAVVRAGVATLRHHHARLSEEQRTLLMDRVDSQGSRLEQMLTDLLDIDRLRRGVVEPKRARADVAVLAREVVDGIANHTHPVSFVSTTAFGDVDAGHVARIVENLVRNAVKYTPSGTPIEVAVRRDATGVVIVVADEGPGIPEEQRASIFEAFVRGDDAHPSPGTGVGLDLVRRLAELHGGSAWADERPGGGARFWVSLPDDVDRPQLSRINA